MAVSRTAGLLMVAALLLSACAGTNSPAGERAASLPVDDSCSDGFFWDAVACTTPATIELADVLSGGPPPDGIPPIDSPVLESIADADTWLAAQSPVLALRIDGVDRAYPLAIMTWHEIVNDEVNGRPVVVTYCPLCNSGLAFDRRIIRADGTVEVLDFGTSGRLFNSNLLMYDRQTRTLWSQFTGTGVVGAGHLGTELDRIPTTVLSWAEFLDVAGDDALVLSRDTGISRPYGNNPYQGYDRVGTSPFLYRGETDDRLELKTRVIGLADQTDPLAVERSLVEELSVFVVEVGTERVILVHQGGAASALDTSRIDDGTDIGAVAAFVGGDHDWSSTPDGAVRRDDGTVFDISGLGVAGPGTGTQLQPVAIDDTFWFVWFAFIPESRVLTAEGIG